MLSLLVFSPIALVGPLWAQRAEERPVTRIVADYDAELRGADGHVDTQLMIQQLKALGVNCYFWLIWHAKTDWEDLQTFLPAAQQAGIDVWVYLCPPSEPPPSEPFGLDFVRWGEEIARLSIKHDNLRAWVIDDFYANHATLTPEYVGQMQRAAKSVNPKLHFLPLMYYHEIHYGFVEAYREVIDGVVVAYPTSREELVRAGRVLRDEIPAPARCVMSYPWEQPSAPGDMATISRTLAVKPGAAGYRLSLQQRDLFTAATEGYHVKQILLDDQVIWEEDVAGGDIEWHRVDLDLTPAVAGKQTVTLALRAYDKKGVSNFGVEVEWADLTLEGFDPSEPSLGQAEGWEKSTQGAWQLTWHPTTGGHHRFRLPYVVMPAGTPQDLRKRLPGSQGTPEELAQHVEMILEAMAAGECEGFVTYCLPKTPNNPYFEAVRDIIQRMLPRLDLAR